MPDAVDGNGCLSNVGGKYYLEKQNEEDLAVRGEEKGREYIGCDRLVLV